MNIPPRKGDGYYPYSLLVSILFMAIGGYSINGFGWLSIHG